MQRDPAEDGDDGSGVDSSSGSTSDACEFDLESMTGKGIKRLCSELLELKKASDEDFQRNVYSNLSAFIRIFEEVGAVESELIALKKHILTQKKLVQDLMSNLYLEIVNEDSREIKAEEIEDLDPCSPNRFGAHRYSILEKLDVLLSEHRTEEALTVLETETKAFQNLQMKKHLLPSMVSYMSAISDRKTRIADQFSSVAEHSRVSHPELQKALSGLCRLGENTRANLLLLRFYRSHLECCVHELNCSTSFQQGTYIRELAKIIFSAIFQAARSYFILYGETSSHTSEIIQWAREETEAFSHSFDKYVKSISENNGGLSLAVEAVNTALSFCALLKPQKIVLQSYLMELIKPCMEEVLQIHMAHFKKVISISTTTDTWVLSNFLISRISGDKPSFSGIGGEVEYCLLTSSGRQFVTLMQEIVDDIAPLITLRMESSILKGLTDLFNEYLHSLEKALPNRGKVVENDLPRITSFQKLQQQLSLLANSSTIAHFFPSIAGSIVKGVKPSNNELFPEDAEFSSLKELDSWALSVREAANRLRDCFCQQFVHEIMSPSLESDTEGQWISSSSEVSMPSCAFQALFVRLRQIERSKPIFAVEDEIMGKLLEELMETMIVWLSNNQEYWKRTEDCSSIPQYSYFEQVNIDMCFLLETAKFGGYYSDELMVTALDLVARVRATFTGTESDLNSAVPDDEWALKAAKLAIEKLLEVEVADSDPEEEPAVSFGEDPRTHTLEDVTLSHEEGSTEFSDYTDSYSDKSAESLGEDMTRILVINNLETESLDGNFENGHSDDDGFGSPTIHSVPMGDGHDVIGANIGTYMMSEVEGTEELVESITVELLGEDMTRLLEINNLETESLDENFKNCHSDDEGLGSPAIHIVAMGDGHEVIGANIGTNMMSGIKGAEELVECVTAESLGEDMTRLFVINNLETESLDENIKSGHSDDDGLGSPAIRSVLMRDGHEVIRANIGTHMMSEIEGTEEMVESITGSDQLVTDERPLAIEANLFEISNELDTGIPSSGAAVTVGCTFLGNSDKLDASVAYSDYTERIMIVLDDLGKLDRENETGMVRSGDLSDSTDEGVGSHHTILDELEQDCQHRVTEEADETPSFKEEQPLDGRVNELVLEVGYEKQGGGGGKHSGDDVRPKRGRDRLNNSSIAEGLRKNRKELRAVRPKWH